MIKHDSVMKEVLRKIEISDEEFKELEGHLKNFTDRLKQKINAMKKKPEIFVGGSFAKKTIIKKDEYDIDVFLRFDKNEDEKKISAATGKLLSGFGNVSVVHGSRDYFRIKINENLFIELIPVLKVESKKDAKNITDLSYSHVKYINKKIKNKKILDDIKIAKAFCHANKCYGAESYIRGFSGYSLELLVYYYKSFMKMIKELSKGSNEKIIIDIEKDYKNKKDVLIDMNSSKLESPIILVDPTYPGRNALAALSYETFEKFKKACREFLKTPSIKSFEPKKIDMDKIKKDAVKNKQEFLHLEVSTDKQEGDIAGSKLLKFYNHLGEEMKKYYEIKNRGFNYNGRKSARYFFVAKKKEEIILGGPFKDDVKNVSKFKKEHKNIYEKNKRLFAREKITRSASDFVKNWISKNKKRMKEMSVENIKVA